MLASAGLVECVAGVVSSTNGFIDWHLCVGLDPMFPTTELPTCIADLDAAVADLITDCLTHWWLTSANTWAGERLRRMGGVESAKRVLIDLPRDEVTPLATMASDEMVMMLLRQE